MRWTKWHKYCGKGLPVDLVSGFTIQSKAIINGRRIKTKAELVEDSWLTKDYFSTDPDNCLLATRHLIPKNAEILYEIVKNMKIPT